MIISLSPFLLLFNVSISKFKWSKKNLGTWVQLYQTKKK